MGSDMHSVVPRSLLALSVLFLLALGCGGKQDDPGNVGQGDPEAGTEAGQPETGGEPDADAGIPSSEAGDTAPEVGPVECPAATHISTAAELETAVEALQWGMRQLLPTGKNLSVDLVFDAEVELATTGLTLPMCNFRGCSAIDVQFGAGNGTCLETTNVDAGFGSSAPFCTRFRVASGASFRILKVSLMGGFFGAERPTLLPLPLCKAPCATAQRECANLQVCMPAVDKPHAGSELDTELGNAQGSYCGTCLGQSAAQCACFAFDGPKPEGTACYYDTSDDTSESGSCHAGRCSRD
jgi:hypothetical protein